MVASEKAEEWNIPESLKDIFLRIKKDKEDKAARAELSFRERDILYFDMLSMLTYMSAIATAGISRDILFEYTSRQEYVPARYLRKIFVLARNWSYGYANACKLVSERTKVPLVKDFLRRLSSAMSTGEPEKEFLKTETETMLEIYTNKYERALESLRKWTDGYTALLVSTTLIATVILMSMMIFSIGGTQTTIILTMLLIASVSLFGAYVIWRVSPKEIKVHALQTKPKEQKLARLLCVTLVPTALMLDTFLFSMGVASSNGAWKLFMLTAALFAPIGILAKIDDWKIDRRDADASTFFKMLGITAGSMGTTVTRAMENLDRKAVGVLENEIKLLHTRLAMGISPRICWERFVGETGSELIKRAAMTFLDAVDLGGDPAEIGKIVSASTLGAVLLRARRKLISSGFANLVIPLHATMSGLLAFVAGTLTTFNDAIRRMFVEHMPEMAGAAAQLPTGIGFIGNFGVMDAPFIKNFVFITILILTVANSLAPKAAEGGSNFKIFYFATVMCFISGAVLLAVSALVSKIFAIQII